MNQNELKHHGIKGQRWGVRRYQNKDGTLTEEGKKRAQYGTGAQRGERERQQISAATSGAVGIVSGNVVGGLSSIARYANGGGKGRQARLEKKLTDKTISSEQRGKLETKLAAQKKFNSDRERYDNYVSNGKMYVQDFLMGGFSNGEMYRNARARGAGRVRSFFESAHLSPISAVLRGTANKKRYGDWFIAGDRDEGIYVQTNFR